jgi:hypothetical protein
MMGSGQLQLIVAESTDGGQTWSEKFATTTSSSSANRSALPAVSILPDGAIGLLSANYTGTSNSNGTPTQFRHSSWWLSRLQVLSIMVAIGLRLAEETLVHGRGRRLELQLGWVDINNLLVIESN